MSDKLRELRRTKQIPAKEIVAVIQRLYPKYDKVALSKCENGDTYGVEIKPDALDAVYAEFAPELLEAHSKPKKTDHRLTCRISARLEDGEYSALQQHIRADGYATMQDWLTDTVRAYLEKKEQIMKGLIITTNNTMRIAEFSQPAYKSIGEVVGGFIEIVHPQRLDRPYCMVVNEDGPFRCLPLNLYGSYLYGTEAHGNPIVGNIVILKEGFVNDEPDLIGLSDEECSTFADQISAWSSGNIRMEE